MQEDGGARQRLTGKQYETFAGWFKEVGLLSAASFVAQKVLSGSPLSDPVVVMGVVIFATTYYFAVRLMLKA